VSPTERSAVHRRTFLASAAAGVGAGLGGGATALASAAEGYEPLGSARVRGAHELVVDGTTGFVAAADGFATVDLADPADPTVLAERRGLLPDREGGPLELVWDLAVDGDRLLVAGPAGAVAGLRALAVYDVSDPSAPSRTAVHELDTPVHNLDLADGVVHLTGNARPDQPMVSVDVAGGTPTEVAEWRAVDADPAWEDVASELRPLHDVVVQDGVAHCAYWDAGTYLVDVSDPADPSAVGHVGAYEPSTLAEFDDVDVSRERLEPPGNDHHSRSADDGSVLAVGAEAWNTDIGGDDGGPGGVTLYDRAGDLSRLGAVEPTVPADATISTGVTTTAHNFELVGARLYSACYRAGVKLHDVTDPADPTLLAHWRRPDDRSFWTAQVVEAGSHFAATSMGRRGSEGVVYTFPDEAGEQADQPPLEPTPTPTPTPTPSGPGTATDTPTPSPATPTPAAGGTVETSEPDPEPSPTTTSSPGLGPLAGAAGLGVAAWRMLGDDRD